MNHIKSLKPNLKSVSSGLNMPFEGVLQSVLVIGQPRELTAVRRKSCQVPAERLKPGIRQILAHPCHAAGCEGWQSLSLPVWEA